MFQFHRILAVSLVGSLGFSLPAQSANLDSIHLLNQNEFRLLSEDLGAALSYKPLTPAEPLGITGFDVGVEVTDTQLANSAVFKKATASGTSSLVIPQVHAYKGLPFGIDIGASFAAVPDSNIKLWGVEARYAIMKGGPASPALALRGSYTKLEGVDQLAFDTTGVDLSISKGFTFLTPYAGIGQVWVHSTPDASVTSFSGVHGEDFSLTKYFIGLNMNLAFINIAVEADRTGDATSYGLKLGWRF